VTEKKRAGLPMQTAKPEPEHFAKSIYDGIAFFLARPVLLGDFAD
jgi:hypothetical protein